jgi:hypothetical protein
MGARLSTGISSLSEGPLAPDSGGLLQASPDGRSSRALRIAVMGSCASKAAAFNDPFALSKRTTPLFRNTSLEQRSQSKQTSSRLIQATKTRGFAPIADRTHLRAGSDHTLGWLTDSANRVDATSSKTASHYASTRRILRPETRAPAGTLRAEKANPHQATDRILRAPIKFDARWLKAPDAKLCLSNSRR